VRTYYESSTAEGGVPDCPQCHARLTIDLEQEELEPPAQLAEHQKGRQGILERLDMDKWRSSSKIEALVEELERSKRDDSTTKVRLPPPPPPRPCLPSPSLTADYLLARGQSIVFSQFVNFLDLIAFRLQRAGYKICRLEGGMSPQARDNTIQHFMKNADVTVFLVSLKAGGVALNLTEASRVYLMVRRACARASKAETQACFHAMLILWLLLRARHRTRGGTAR
jgi:DNA repair protein RAD16